MRRAKDQFLSQFDWLLIKIHYYGVFCTDRRPIYFDFAHKVAGERPLSDKELKGSHRFISTESTGKSGNLLNIRIISRLLKSNTFRLIIISRFLCLHRQPRPDADGEQFANPPARQHYSRRLLRQPRRSKTVLAAVIPCLPHRPGPAHRPGRIFATQE